jgi:hypothetical protein
VHDEGLGWVWVWQVQGRVLILHPLVEGSEAGIHAAGGG